ncbi:MAG: IPT/TIG domain-containing protein [Silvibacterium sp.]|nr:IPT/TIG domain-containing protein [Silvibacterium sp.]
MRHADIWKRILLVLLLTMICLIAGGTAYAGGPRWVAGPGYFVPSAKGKPIVWANGFVPYYLDQGDLSPTIDQTQARAMVAAAAGGWNSVPTAAVTLTFYGHLAEDVNGTNVTGGPNGVVAMPADIQPTATNRPLAVVFDEDGSVIDAFFGPGASSASECQENGVVTMIDNINSAGNIAHALMIVNGLCATDAMQIAVLQYQLLRAFGRILGLDWSQTNEEMFASTRVTTEGLAGWPILHPIERLCNASGVPCMPNPATLRPDDIASVNRVYPVTAGNIGSFAARKKILTAPNTISVQGRIQFRRGQGMQGVNVVLRPMIPGTDLPDVRYTVTAVSGAYFLRNSGNPVAGTTDSQGMPLNRFGSDDETLEGFFDLSGVPLPPNQTSADYQLTFEPVDPLNTGNFSVGPYVTGQVSPSGTMPTIYLPGLAAGSSVYQVVGIGNSADELHSGDDGTVSAPVNLPDAGEWTARITGYSHSSWLEWHARANREFTVEAVALDETGRPTTYKAQPVLGMWNGTDVTNAPPITAAPQPFNGVVPGLTGLQVITAADSEVRLGVADLRGDGRPDFLYRGRVLYADSVSPSRLPASGGAIVITGVGFRPNSIVLVNNAPAAVTSVSPTQIIAVVPASGGVTGNVLVEVQDPKTLGVTIIADGLSYDAQNGDELAIVTAPGNSVPTGVPLPFTVRAMNWNDQSPAAGVTVSYSVTKGSATLDCGQPVCRTTTGGDGTATVMVKANATNLTTVTASLTNGASIAAEFTGQAPPAIAVVSPNLYLAIGGTAQWNAQGIVLSNGQPVAGQAVTWTPMGAGVSATNSVSTSGANGVVTQQITAGPLNAGDVIPVNACLSGGGSCAQFNVIAVHTQTAQLVAESGTSQMVAASASLAPVLLKVTDAIGHPMAGVVVMFYEVLDAWTRRCPLHGACPPAQVLEQQSVQAISAAGGTVALIPLSMPGKASRLFVTAVTGASAVLTFELDKHP